MHDVNTIGGIAGRLEHLSDAFRSALAKSDHRRARDVSGEALALLSESARLVRNAQEQGLLTLPPDPVGIEWAEATATWSHWEPTYQAPYETYANAQFRKISLRDGLSKILHASDMRFRLPEDRHELVLVGDKKPFAAAGKKGPWLAVVCVSQVTALMRQHAKLANIRRS